MEHRRGKKKAEEEAAAAEGVTSMAMKWTRTMEMAAKKAISTQALLASQSASAPMEGTGPQQPAAAAPPPPPPAPRASARLGNLVAHMQRGCGQHPTHCTWRLRLRLRPAPHALHLAETWLLRRHSRP